MPLGPTRTFKVTRGDSIDISAWAHYEEASSSSGFNFTLFITNTYDDTNSESLLGNLSLGLGFSGANGTRVPDVPYAYLKYIVYRADSSIAEEGEHLISSSANSNWEELALSTVIEEDGYIKVFALNEDAVNVWFDDFSIVHKQSPIAQQTDYYPFGLEITATQYNRDAWLENRFNRFQGQELDEQMGWVQFKWRNHQPALGRFFNIDPLSEKYLYNSTYAFSENKVVAHVELEGLEAAEADNGSFSDRASQSFMLSMKVWLNAFAAKNGYDPIHAEGAKGWFRELGTESKEIGRAYANGIMNFFSDTWDGIKSLGQIDTYANGFKNGFTYLLNGGDLRRDFTFSAIEGISNSYDYFIDIPNKSLRTLAFDVGYNIVGPLALGAAIEGVGLAGYGAYSLGRYSIGRIRAMVAARGVSVYSGAGGGSLPMTVEQILPQGSKISNIVNDVKGMTWMTGNEHAVVRLANGQKAIVSGGPGGIYFRHGQIRTLFGHTHPTTAPPSLGDFNFLRSYRFFGGSVGQSRQYVIHGGQTSLIRP